MRYRATTGLLLAALAGLLLHGCGDTRVAFCSGGEEFCGRFFDDTFGEPEPPESGPPSSALHQALAIGLQTPAPAAEAIATLKMPELVEENPQLVAMWLTAATLSHQRRADPVLTTTYLDQTRAWLDAALVGLRHPAMQPAVELFAHYAESRDPALAEIARGHAGRRADPIGSAADAYPRAIEVLSAASTASCCSTSQLAAAAVVLCAYDAPGAACDAAHNALQAMPVIQAD